MKRLLAAALAATLALAAQAGIANAKRVALVIGNGTYDNAPAAETAVRDATSVAQALEQAGWTVTAGTDLDRADMRQAIVDFARAQSDAEASLIYYSGHAFRSGGQTYAAPTDALAVEIPFVMLDGVPFDLLLRLVSNKPGQSVVFVDGAQLRGFTPTDFVEPGITQLEAPEGVLIVSAAPPGRAIRRSRWRDSRFAQAIVDAFLSPGEPVMQTVNGRGVSVWHTGAVDAGFALVETEEIAQDNDLEAEIELAYWRTAERTGRVEDYRAYLDRYPNGVFADFARARLGEDAGGGSAGPQVDPVVAAENQLNLNRTRRRQVQEWLQALGFDPRGVDGIFGPGTRNAIRRWQLSQRLQNTGYLNRNQMELLANQGTAAIAANRQQAEEARRVAEAEDNAFWAATGATGRADELRAYLARYPEGLHATEARAALAAIAEAEADQQARRERRVWRRAEQQNSAEAYRDYLGRYPQGIYRDEALARLDQIEGAERRDAQLRALQRTEEALRLSAADRKSVEARLQFLGFQPGPVDGRFNNRTRGAIKGYQNARGFAQTGYLNRQTVVMLVRDTSAGQQGQVRIDGTQVIRGLLDALGR
ncbi:MAG: peptidoglycan-binding protein [Pseudomonadota bacterium]